jgi:hypothetical protein
LLLVAQEDLVIFYLDDSAVRDGDSENVRRELLDARLGVPDRLAVNVPILLPNLGRDLGEKSGLFNPITELGAVDRREGQNR